MEVAIGVALALISVTITVLLVIVIRLRRRRRGMRTATAHDSGVSVDEAAWAEIVKQLKKGRTWDEPGDGSRAGGQR